MSVMLWRRMHSRSTPRPKAKPVTRSGSYPTACSTLRIHHAGPAELDPLIVPTEVRLDTRLGEREERRSKPDVHVTPEVARGEHPQHTLQVRHRDVLVHQQPFHLMEHRVVRGVGGVRPVDAAQAK